MENKQLQELIDDLEKISVYLEKVKDLNKIQEDYIDFKDITDIKKENVKSEAFKTLYELNRTKQSHLTLSYVIEDYINVMDEILENRLPYLYDLLNQTQQDDETQ